jgi:RHH-type proline utilization regulon transcriptional repressor/proline dehydrogenase/delta 1-pyrroline-5-carboxylate dehydrogenase
VPEADRIAAALATCEDAVRTEFAVEHDHFKLVGQDNLRRYRPCDAVRVRVTPADSVFEVFTMVSAARLAGAQVTVSAAPETETASLDLLKELAGAIDNSFEFVIETDAELAAAIQSGKIDRLRLAAPDRVPALLFSAANEAGGCLVSRAVSAEGRLELLWYLREQSVSIDYHRYGNLGTRAGEARAEVR